HQLEAVEMLPGDSDYKRRWAKHSRRILDIECFNSRSIRAQSFRLMRGLKRILTGWKKSSPKPERGLA
ncbi:MAG: hypothetical protein KDK97_22650, partial [Verrucomicrobiales bacterium]|nr:hypothetical protein [Verrucomicrobiales bacterium]